MNALGIVLLQFKIGVKHPKCNTDLPLPLYLITGC